jgi:hypothetical protein
MKVIIRRSTVAGGQRVEQDAVVDVTKEDAAILVSLKKAVPASKENLAELQKRKKETAE